jgi:hypothetical protein
MANITVRTFASLEPGSLVWDTSVRGFGVRRQRGDPVYVLKYRIAGRQRFLTIGRHGSPWTPDTARREARRLLGLIASGKDPAATAPERTILGDAAAAYLRYSEGEMRPRTFAEVRRYLGVWSPLADRPLVQIDRTAVAA